MDLSLPCRGPESRGNETWGPRGMEGPCRPEPVGPRYSGYRARAWFFCRLAMRQTAFTAPIAKGPNLYANSVIALDALTGKLRWYYQMVHHDLWDYDMNAPPALIDVKCNGKTIPALAETNKMSLLFILDRRTGKPIFGVEERPVPKGDTPGRVVFADRSPFLSSRRRLSRTTMTMEDVSKRTPEAEKFCGEWLSRLRLRGTVHAVRHDRISLDAGNHGRRKLGRRLLRSAARLHLRQHEQPGHGWANGPDGSRARLSPIAIWADTPDSSIRMVIHASSLRGAN